jgi:hypothetical protein
MVTHCLIIAKDILLAALFVRNIGWEEVVVVNEKLESAVRLMKGQRRGGNGEAGNGRANGRANVSWNERDVSFYFGTRRSRVPVFSLKIREVGRERWELAQGLNISRASGGRYGCAGARVCV